MTAWKAVRYPKEFQALNSERVISRYGLWAVRVYLVMGSISLTAMLVQYGSPVELIPAAAGIGIILTLGYWFFSRPMDERERRNYLTGGGAERYCPACGTAMSPGDNHCIKCGEDLTPYGQ